ncbi:hypothetical protein [Varibaculum cambriense]|uniref:hypothetical protein n=1 Tax=Varibaculum cambriense TaxID=184870 RepID=UPI00258D8B96|nr:hypothetical protein [Varibaculum cambriense]MDU1224789.1 hypothetical protein [Varibaculum cambriense]
MNNENMKPDHETATARGREITDATDWLEKTLEANGGESLLTDLKKAGRANGFSEDQLKNARRMKKTYPLIKTRHTKEIPPRSIWYLDTEEER